MKTLALLLLSMTYATAHAGFILDTPLPPDPSVKPLPKGWKVDDATAASVQQLKDRGYTFVDAAALAKQHDAMVSDAVVAAQHTMQKANDPEVFYSVSPVVEPQPTACATATPAHSVHRSRRRHQNKQQRKHTTVGATSAPRACGK